MIYESSLTSVAAALSLGRRLYLSVKTSPLYKFINGITEAIMNIQTPLQAYLGQAKSGQTRWWSWICGFWFAIVFFFYAQIIIGVIMIIAAMGLAPDAISSINAAQNPGDVDPNALLISMIVGISPLLPVLFWVLREKIQNTFTKKLLIGISALVMMVTAVGFYQMMSGQAQESAAMTGKLIAAHPILYGFILLSFPPLVIGFWLAQKFIHKRTFLSLLTAAKKFRWKRLFFTMFVFWCVVTSLSILLHITQISPVKFSYDPIKFFGYALVTLIFIPMQSATEEIVLRGYVNQGLARFISSPWLVFVISSAAFAAMHLGNPEITKGAADTPLLIAISGYFIFGMFACLLTWVDGGLESAIGMHAANNMFGAMIIGYENSALPTPTLFKAGQNTGLDSLITLIALGIVFAILYKTRKPLEPIS